MRLFLLVHLFFSRRVIGSGGRKKEPTLKFVTSNSLPAGTYKAVEQNGTICPELSRLVSFEMVITDGGEGQLLASFNAEVLSTGQPAHREPIRYPTRAALVWYGYRYARSLRQFGSLRISQSPNCFHVEPKAAAGDFLLDLDVRLGLAMSPPLTAQLIFCQTEIGIIVGMGRKVTYWGAWNSTLYGFRVAKLNNSTGGSSSDGWADSDPVKSIRGPQFLSAGRALTLAQIGEEVSDGVRSGSLDGWPKSSAPELPIPESSLRSNEKRRSTVMNFVTSDSLPGGTYKAVEQNGTICPELPRLTDFRMVVTDGEGKQLASFYAEVLSIESSTVRYLIDGPKEAVLVRYSDSNVRLLRQFGSLRVGQVPDCFHVEPKGTANDFILGLYRRLGLVKPLRVASQLVFCQTEIGMIVGIGKQLNTNRDRHRESTTYGFRIALSECSRGGMADDVQEISRKRSSALQAGGGPLKLAKRDEGSDASNGSAKSSYKSPVPGLALPESDYSRRGEDETGEGGSTSGMGDHSQPGVAFPRKAAIEEWEGEYGVPSDRVANRTSLRLLSGEGSSKFHRKGKLTSGEHVSADWPTSSFDVRNFNVRTSGSTGQSAEASVKFPESARRGADDQNYTTDRESSTPSENDLLLPIDFDDLWLDPEALLDEKWLETLSDSAGSIQSEGNTAEHHREINRGSTTKGADDLLSPMEFDSLWPETKASSDDKWVEALFDSAEASSSLAPAVVSTEEWTSIPDGTYLATGTGLDQVNKVTVNIRTDYPTHNRRAQLIFDTRGFECPMTLPEVTAVCLETCLQLDFSSEEHALDLVILGDILGLAHISPSPFRICRESGGGWSLVFDTSRDDVSGRKTTSTIKLKLVET